MNRHTTFATVLCLGAAVMALADVKPMPPATPQDRTPTKLPPTIQAQITGKITWKGNVKLSPGSGDTCSHFKISVLEHTATPPSSGGVSVPGTKDLGISTKGLGNIKQGSCSFVIGKGVPEDTLVILTARYGGAMGSAADKRSGSTAPFTVKGKASQNILVEFSKI
jgi:hypothetical protein